MRGDVKLPRIVDCRTACRCVSNHVRDSFFQPIFTRTSPVYVQAGHCALELPQAAAFFDRALDDAVAWVQQTGKFRNDVQRNEVVSLFREGQAVCQQLCA